MNYVNAVPEGTWLLGVSRNSIRIYLYLIKDFFLNELGIDMWQINNDLSRIAFAVVKGDKTTLKVNTLNYGYHIYLVADLTERRDGTFKFL